MRRTDKNKSLSSAQISILHLIRYVDETPFHASSFINKSTSQLHFFTLLANAKSLNKKYFHLTV